VGPVVTAWVIAVVWVAISIGLFPHYLSYASRSTLTPLIGVLIIAAIGQSFVIGTGGIDLSPGSVITLSGLAVGFIGNGPGGSLWLGLVVAILIGVGAGALNGVLVEVLGLDSMVATLATYEGMLGLATVWTNSAEGTPSPQAWSNFLLHNWDGFSIVLGMAVLLMFVVAMVIAHTTPGRHLTAASVSSVASYFQGIHYRRYRFSAYVFGGVVYAFAGICLVGVVRTPTTDMGTVYQFGTIVAVILGGASLTGGRLHPGATVAGAAFLIVVEQDILAFGLSTGFQNIIEGVIIVGAVVAMVGGSDSPIRRWRTKRSRRVGETDGDGRGLRAEHGQLEGSEAQIQ
jgi:ribose transport system permease protein